MQLRVLGVQHGREWQTRRAAHADPPPPSLAQHPAVLVGSTAAAAVAAAGTVVDAMGVAFVRVD